jgi:hypothetical protein
VTTAFEAHIRTVVAEFLETALVVDDEGLPKALPPVDTGPPIAVHSRADLTLVEPPTDQLAAVEAQHPLSTKELTDAFADMGIVCGVLAPTEEDEIQQRFLKAAARADLVVLDWDLHRDGGAMARNLIKALLAQDDLAERRRLRVIAIYTGQPGLGSIIEQVRKALDESKSLLAADGMSLTNENVRIVAFSKPLGQKTTNAMEISESALPARLASEFAQLTSGLVPSVTLAALTALRNETHRLLQALSSDMDLGYLGHRVASSFPEDAEEHLVDSVSAEIGSILSDGAVGAAANLTVIRSWLTDARADSPPLDCGSALKKPRKIIDADIERMLDVGLGRDETLEGYTDKDLGKNLLRSVRREGAHLFTNTSADADASADVFALRMATRTLYKRPARILQLGTVVLFDEAFLVCVQPRCDSIRIDPEEPRSFPFLPFLVVDEGETEHGYVVEHPDKDRLVRLRLRSKPSAIRTFTFASDESRRVQAREIRGSWNFYTTGNRRFRWVADLKPDFSQRVAVDLAAELARVGLNESELVRLSKSG